MGKAVSRSGGNKGSREVPRAHGGAGAFVARRRRGRFRRRGQGRRREGQSGDIVCTGPCYCSRADLSSRLFSSSQHFIPKYSRYEKRHKNLSAHASPAFRIEIGDTVTVGQCRPLSKTVRFNVVGPSSSCLESTLSLIHSSCFPPRSESPRTRRRPRPSASSKRL